MTRAREWCLAVSPSPDRIMIMGGGGAGNSVEERVVLLSSFCISTHCNCVNLFLRCQGLCASSGIERLAVQNQHAV